MARIYASLIRNGVTNPKTGAAYTLENVPERIRENVRTLLEVNT